jgi:2-aminobenzoate-CoA ligase
MTGYDSFARDHLPPEHLQPHFLGLEELGYAVRFNCAEAFLDRPAATGRDRPAFLFGDARWTYGQLKDQVDRIARVLVEDMGVRPGNRVLLRGFNNPMMAACWLAVAKMGGVVVATMPLLRAGELAYIVEKARIGHCLCQDSLVAEVEETRRQVPGLRQVRTFTALGDGDASLDRAMPGKASGFAAYDTAGDDVVLVAFTSGTTGKPKGTVHFHRDCLAICDTFARHTVGVRGDDLFAGSPPLAFTFGLGALALFPLRCGAASVLVETFGPTTLLETIERYRVTGLWTAPTAYRAMTGVARNYDLSSLRLCVSAGEHLPAATWEGWREATGIRIIDGIGSTEMLHVFVSASGDAVRPGATGRAVPFYRAKVVDERGGDLPVGAEGWLAVQGPTGCRYLDDRDRQQVYVRNGWNITGDIYRQDEEGYFWFVARGDDMIISAGYNISGPEVENALLAHPLVAECAVVAAPDAERGHVVKAYVVMRPGQEPGDAAVETLQSHVKRTIAPYKYPRQVEFVDALPKTPTGKLQRFKLREDAERKAAP